MLGGLAIVLELRLRVDAVRGDLRCASSRAAGAKHTLDLQGLGACSLAFNGDRLAVLVAPTMPSSGIVPRSAYRPLLRLPGGDRGDYAEGIACVGNEIAVVCDRPSETRLRGSTGMRIDFYRLPAADAAAG